MSILIKIFTYCNFFVFPVIRGYNFIIFVFLEYLGDFIQRSFYRWRKNTDFDLILLFLTQCICNFFQILDKFTACLISFYIFMVYFSYQIFIVPLLSLNDFEALAHFYSFCEEFRFKIWFGKQRMGFKDEWGHFSICNILLSLAYQTMRLQSHFIIQVNFIINNQTYILLSESNVYLSYVYMSYVCFFVF